MCVSVSMVACKFHPCGMFFVCFCPSLSFSCGHYAARLLEYLCECGHIQYTILWLLDFHLLPKLPSNITHGLCFDPLASHSPQPPLKHIVIYVPADIFVQGYRDARCPFKPFVLQIYTVLSLFPMPISSCSFSLCSAGLIKAQQGLALFPVHSAIRSLKGILHLLLLHSPRLFFFKARKTVPLAFTFTSPCFESAVGFFSGSEKLEMNDACFRRQE